MINLNKLAVCISKEEGKKQEVDIAQIKEVLAIALDKLSAEKPSDVLKLLESR